MDLHKLVDGNQSIKIVPSIEDSLRSNGVSVDLDDSTQAWLFKLKTAWKTWKKSPAVENSIDQFFNSRNDPHRTALGLVIKCEEFKDCKPKTLPFTIMEILYKYTVKCNVVPEDYLKFPAFEIATKQRNQHFLTLIAKTYNLSSIKNSVVPVVKDIIESGNYKQACQIVIALELFDDIPVEDLLFPMILQDKTNIIDAYLIECPDQIKPFLMFLDKLLDKSFSIREYAQKYIEEHNIGEVRYEKLHYKPLGKLAARLCNKFKIPIETCKNLSKNRTTGGLKYLIYQKYQENNVSSSVWDDLVRDSLNQNAESALEFIDTLSEYDKKEALKWAEYLKMPESSYPAGLKEISANTQPVDTDENWDNTPHANNIQECYKLKLPMDSIIVVDTGEKFYDMMSSNIIESKVVSIDCEWKPSFGATQSQVALIQIATMDKVFLIDTIMLNNKQYSSFWYTFCKSLLDNAEVIKVGFGLEQDLKEIKSSVSGLSNIKIKGEGLLDMALLWKSLMNSGLILPNSDGGGNSLSSLVQACFGTPLAKEEQCSNWELRPLRVTQMQYAALDAYVLIELYYFVQNMCLQQGINFEEISNDIMLEGKQRGSKKPKVADRLQLSLSNIPVSLRSVNEIKFLVHPDLSQLMSYLRYCGIDTAVVPPTMLWHDVINLAISDDRYILLPKIKYTPNASFPQSSIFEVGKGSLKEQLKKILVHFNVDVKKDQLLSHCIYCNEKDLTKLSESEVNNICTELNKSSRSHYVQPNSEEDFEDNYDDFLNDSDDDDDDLYQPIHQVHVASSSNVTTKKGVSIQLSEGDRLISAKKSAILCESCGKLLWDEEELMKNVCDIVQSITKLSIS